jgi:hypothetical protein
VPQVGLRHLQVPDALPQWSDAAVIPSCCTVRDQRLATGCAILAPGIAPLIRAVSHYERATSGHIATAQG